MLGLADCCSRIPIMMHKSTLVIIQRLLLLGAAERIIPSVVAHHRQLQSPLYSVKAAHQLQPRHRPYPCLPRHLRPHQVTKNGLSTGAKAGIGIGAALGALAILGLIAWMALRMRRRRRGTESIAQLGGRELEPVGELDAAGKPKKK